MLVSMGVGVQKMVSGVFFFFFFPCFLRSRSKTWKSIKAFQQFNNAKQDRCGKTSLGFFFKCKTQTKGKL